MARPKASHSPALLKRSIDEVIASDLKHPGQPLVEIHPKSGKRPLVALRKPGRLISVRDQIVRIQQEADPLGFLADAMNGKLFEVHNINEEGEVETRLMGASLGDRIQIARFLANKVLPTLSVSKRIDDPHVDDPNRHNQGFGRPGDGRPDFAQMVEIAATKAGYIEHNRTTDVVDDVIEGDDTQDGADEQDQ